jgi:flagellar hook-associated protein 1
VMTGPGALRMAGNITPASVAAQARATELRVTDPASGMIELIDSATGQSVSTGYLDSQGQATIGGYRVSMTGQAAAGDGFTLTANTAPNADSRALERMIALADADPGKGQGGFAQLLAEMTTDMGAQVKASQTKQDSLEASHESLSRKLAEVSAVDLDKEAASLIELQQAYQASAQALSVARQLFDTILNAM